MQLKTNSDKFKQNIHLFRESLFLFSYKFEPKDKKEKLTLTLSFRGQIF